MAHISCQQTVDLHPYHYEKNVKIIRSVRVSRYAHALSQYAAIAKILSDRIKTANVHTTVAACGLCVGIKCTPLTFYYYMCQKQSNRGKVCCAVQHNMFKLSCHLKNAF